MFTCSVKSEDYKIKTKYASIYDIHFKPLHQPKCCRDIIDTRALDDNDREYKHYMKKASTNCFGGMCHTEYVC